MNINKKYIPVFLIGFYLVLYAFRLIDSFIMTVHFINNISINLFHVVFADGTDINPTMRIAIAQTIMFIIVTVRWFIWKIKK